MSLDDDTLADLLFDELRSTPVLALDPDALVRGGRRRLRRRRLLVGAGVATVVAVASGTAAALSLAAPPGIRVDPATGVTSGPRLPRPVSRPPTRQETRKQTRARLDRAVRTLLTAEGVPVHGQVQWGEGDFVNPDGTFDATVGVEPPGPHDVALIFTLFRSRRDDTPCRAKATSHQWWGTTVDRCTRGRGPDGSQVTVRTSEDSAGGITDALVTSVHPDGAYVQVDVVGAEVERRMPRGVDLPMMQRLTASPLLEP
jgi:hypothetical protein